MNLGLKLLRWLKVALLGFALGLFLVAANFFLWSLVLGGNPFGHVHSGPALHLSVDPVRQDLVNVVGSQLSDFRRGDYAGAYAFADSSLQAHFSATVFERMVKTGYPAIAQSQSASFGVILDNGSEAIVTVGVMSQSRHLLQYRYVLHREHGGWKISGVVRVRMEGNTV